MNRRQAILAAAAFVAAPLPAGAIARRIGFLESSSPSARQHLLDAFRGGLRALGHVEGTSIAIEARWAHGRVADLPHLVAELLALNVDVLLAGTTVAALAAKKATQTVPLVFAVPADPVGVGLVASLSRPGGNATGLTTGNIEVVPKRLELLRELAGGKAKRAAVLFNPADPSNVLFIRSSDRAAAGLGIEMRNYAVRNAGEFDAAFAAMKAAGAEILMVAAGALTDTHAARLAALAASTRIPAVYGSGEFVEAGGLLSYSASFSDNYRRAAAYVDRILKGAKPAALPVEQASKFELQLNLRAAKVLGIAIPRSVLLRADRVIE
jgi:putative ABC transport system substrate-binding protein